MARPDQLKRIRAGVREWNRWRRENPDEAIDLREARLHRSVLRGIDLAGADLRGARLHTAVLSGAKLRGANMRGSDLRGASLRRADIRDADLTGAILRHVSVVEAQVANAIFTDCEIYGLAAWNLKGKPADQSNLVIRATANDVAITVDNIEVAQFVFLILNNAKIRSVIDTITSKVVLILGRFSPKRKPILDALRTELRERNYLPILFDFEKPSSRDLTETVSTLAHISRFVIADLTEARSIPQELSNIVPDLPSVPVQPLILAGDDAYGMWEHFERYPWVLPVFEYKSAKQLLGAVRTEVLAPAEKMLQSLRPDAKNTPTLAAGRRLAMSRRRSGRGS